MRRFFMFWFAGVADNSRNRISHSGILCIKPGYHALTECQCFLFKERAIVSEKSLCSQSKIIINSPNYEPFTVSSKVESHSCTNIKRAFFFTQVNLLTSSFTFDELIPINQLSNKAAPLCNQPRSRQLSN